MAESGTTALDRQALAKLYRQVGQLQLQVAELIAARFDCHCHHVFSRHQRVKLQAPPSPHKTTGTVKWFSVNRGYGFLTRDDDGSEIFVHHSAIAKPNPAHASYIDKSYIKTICMQKAFKQHVYQHMKVLQ